MARKKLGGDAISQQTLDEMSERVDSVIIDRNANYKVIIVAKLKAAKVTMSIPETMRPRMTVAMTSVAISRRGAVCFCAGLRFHLRRRRSG